jgi:phosphotriesterase-related protein
MRRKRVGLAVLGCIFVLMGLTPVLAASQIVYVDDDAPVGGNGTSWATAHRYLQDGLATARAQASGGPIEIRMAQGLYKPDRSAEHPNGSGDTRAEFSITPGVQLLGGYAGIGAADPNLRDIVAYPTILSGDLAGNDVEVCDRNKLANEPTRSDNSWWVVNIAGPALLDGLTITGGHALRWYGERMPPDLRMTGSGLWVEGTGITIRDCIFRTNSASEGTGNVLTQAVSPDPTADLLFLRCTFERNVEMPAGRGGAMRLWYGRTAVNACVFRGNRATQGGCVAKTGQVYLEMENCLAVGNTASEGGAVLYNGDGTARLQNCTAAGNRAPAGRFLFDGTPRPDRGAKPPSIEITSCILANDGNEITNGYAATTIKFTDMVASQAVVDPEHAVVWGAGNLDIDPCFAEPGFWEANDTEDPNDDVFVPGDYHLKSRAGRWDPAGQAWVQDAVGSPCIDAGDPAIAFDEEPSPNGKRVNMGYYGNTGEASKSEYSWHLVTAQGPLRAEGVGIALPHEHIFTDLRGPTVAGYGQADPADVVRVMKPWLVAARQAGVGALVECTSIGVGRNVTIVDRVAREVGLPVVVPTGVYGRDNFAPPEHRNMTEDELTNLFISEIREGIEGTGIKAGFIKIATGSSATTALEEKFLRAAGRAARETGAAVASHTPVSSNASLQAGILASIDPNVRLIWVHASSENNRAVQRQLAGRGVYIEFDSIGANPGQDTGLIAAIQELLAAGYADRILLSHDAGYYQPDQPNGGTQRGFTYLIDTFIPKLRAAGVDEATIRMITEINPIRALGFRSSLYETKETQHESSSL